MESSSNAKDLKEENEKLLQELHIANCKLNVTMKTNADLAEELEQLEKRMTGEMEQIRTQCENQLKAYKTMIAKLNAELEKQYVKPNQSIIAVEKAPIIVPDETSLEKEQKWKALEAQYLEEINLLKQKLTTNKQDWAQAEGKISELNEEVELLNEHIVSQKSNLLIKTQQIVELRELLESTQEQNSVLSSEIAGMRSKPNNADRKGNSLFAEVADQRRTLMTKYTQLKMRFIELKSEHENCPRQLRELRTVQKRSERLYEECIRAIKAAQSYNVQTLKQQNNDLNQMVEDTKRRIRYLENQMAAQSSDWVNKLIIYNREEMQKLQTPLHYYQFKHREAMELHENAVKDGYFWRMEAQRLKMKSLNLEVPGDTTLSNNEGSSATRTNTSAMQNQCKDKEVGSFTLDMVADNKLCTVLPMLYHELKEVANEPEKEMNSPKMVHVKRLNVNDMIAKQKLEQEQSTANAPVATTDLCTGTTKPNQMPEK